jgi:hypothetical protein
MRSDWFVHEPIESRHLYGTVLSVHSALPGNSRSIKVKNVMGLVVKLGTLDGVPSPIGPEIFPLYLWPVA